MSALFAFFRLIRLGNLLIMAGTQVAMRYWVILPLLQQSERTLKEGGFYHLSLSLQMNGWTFGLLVFTTLLIAAAGYIINDYFDTKSDRINRPEKQVIGKKITRRQAMAAHLILSSLGMLGGLALAWLCNALWLAGIQLFSIVALWFYSTKFKKQLLTGNIIIALLAALVPLTVGLYEFQAGMTDYLIVMNMMLPESGSRLLLLVAAFTGGYATFAFGTNFIREIVKDIEDINGDMADGCRTIPIVLGVEAARFISIALIALLVILLAYIQHHLLLRNFTYLFYYLTIAVQIPMVIIGALVWQANHKEQFSKASWLIKWVILAGVMSMWVFNIS